MDRVLKQLLESQVLTDDVKSSLVEAWDAKVAETRQQIEEQTRQEFAKRYEVDKAELVETAQQFLEESLRKELTDFAQDRKALAEEKKNIKEFAVNKINEQHELLVQERVKLAKAVKEAKGIYAKQFESHTNLLKRFFVEQVQKELAEFVSDKKALAEERKALLQQVTETRSNFKKVYSDRVQTLEKFVMEQVAKELREFQEDKKLLAEDRAKFKAEAKTKLAETESEFIKKASKIVEATAQKSIRSELSQLKTDLDVAKKNNFGRRIFEAFASEYMASHLAEGSEVRKVQNMLKDVQQQLSESKEQNATLAQEADAAKRKIKLAEDKVVRNNSLNTLLAPLSKDQKVLMSNLLENVKTERLTESFKRYLPTVLNEAKVENKKSSILVESSKSFTGDRHREINEDGTTAEIVQLRKLAGITTK